MSRVNIAAGVGSPRSGTSSAKILASAHSCAQRAQLSLEGLGGVSNLLLLTAAAVALVDSYLTGLMIDRSTAISVRLP